METNSQTSQHTARYCARYIVIQTSMPCLARQAKATGNECIVSQANFYAHRSSCIFISNGGIRVFVWRSIGTVPRLKTTHYTYSSSPHTQPRISHSLLVMSVPIPVGSELRPQWLGICRGIIHAGLVCESVFYPRHI